MTNTIKHLGIVENIQGFHLSVRIVQTSACAGCHVQGYCSSADKKEKIIDITDTAASSYKIGEQVMIIGKSSLGMLAVLLAFVLPFLLLIVSLFIFMELTEGDEIFAGLASLSFLISYYSVLWLNSEKLKRKFSFKIEHLEENSK